MRLPWLSWWRQERTLSLQTWSVRHRKLEELVNATSYKPGTSIRVIWPHDRILPIMQFSADVVDVTNPSQRVKLTITRALDEDMLDEFFKSTKSYLAFIQESFRGMEYHEVDEWISFRGTRPFDPHRMEAKSGT